MIEEFCIFKNCLVNFYHFKIRVEDYNMFTKFIDFFQALLNPWSGNNNSFKWIAKK